MTAFVDLISHLVTLLLSVALSHFGLMMDNAPAPPEPVPVTVPAEKLTPPAP